VRTLPNGDAYGFDVDEIGDTLTEIERHLEVAGLILGEGGPRTLDLGTQDRARGGSVQAHSAGAADAV